MIVLQSKQGQQFELSTPMIVVAMFIVLVASVFVALASRPMGYLLLYIYKGVCG